MKKTCFYFKLEKISGFYATKMPIADFHQYWNLKSELVKCLMPFLFGNCWETALASGPASKMGRMKMHISQQVVKVKWENREERTMGGWILSTFSSPWRDEYCWQYRHSCHYHHLWLPSPPSSQPPSSLLPSLFTSLSSPSSSLSLVPSSQLPLSPHHHWHHYLSHRS